MIPLFPRRCGWCHDRVTVVDRIMERPGRIGDWTFAVVWRLAVIEARIGRPGMKWHERFHTHDD
jgi:hypothetical protein